MASETRHPTTTTITRFLHSTSSNFFSFFPTPPPHPTTKPSPSSITLPFLFPDPSTPPPPPPPPTTSPSSQLKSTGGGARSAFPSTMKIAGLRANAKEGGPAFVGQVFSMCDISGTGLMAVSTHIEIPFLAKRTPEWVKKMFSMLNKNEKNGPVFRFFMDLGDAVSYVKRLNIPTGVVGACRLDLAYEHFKEKPHLFQFVPNEKQVKAANNILKKIPHSGGEKRIDGVPVFTAQNLDIAIATGDGIKWYTPYFFDKKMLDNILEESVDQHFHSLIQIRHMQRRKDVIDDNLPAEVVEDNGENLWEPPEVQEVLDEMGYPGIPLSVISKAAEVQLLDAVDKVLLGNRWLRKATGIQPKFPYRVDSFQKRSAASFLKAAERSRAAANKELGCESNGQKLLKDSSELRREDSIDNDKTEPSNFIDFRLPFGDWFSPKQQKEDKQIRPTDTREHLTEMQLSPLLPKITMVGISTGEAGQLSKASLKKTMEDLTKELEQPVENTNNPSRDEVRHEDRDPLFVSNVGV